MKSLIFTEVEMIAYKSRNYDFNVKSFIIVKYNDKVDYLLMGKTKYIFIRILNSN